MDSSYFESIEKLKNKFGSFVLDADAGLKNKSAALRSRKLSMELRVDLQEYKKISVKNDKSRTKHRTTKE